jgi:Protein of unknown function (DUF3179)
MGFIIALHWGRRVVFHLLIRRNVMSIRRIIIYTLSILFGGLMLSSAGFAYVVKKDGKHYIVDQLGEHWDVTEAKSLGFRPERFRYGIGRHTFVTLDDSHLGEPEYLFDSHRVIGVEDRGEAHAYSVGKLSRHEIANTTLGESPVAAAY